MHASNALYAGVRVSGRKGQCLKVACVRLHRHTIQAAVPIKLAHLSEMLPCSAQPTWHTQLHWSCHHTVGLVRPFHAWHLILVHACTGGAFEPWASRLSACCAAWSQSPAHQLRLNSCAVCIFILVCISGKDRDFCSLTPTNLFAI